MNQREGESDSEYEARIWHLKRSVTDADSDACCPDCGEMNCMECGECGNPDCADMCDCDRQGDDDETELN